MGIAAEPSDEASSKAAKKVTINAPDGEGQASNTKPGRRRSDSRGRDRSRSRSAASSHSGAPPRVLGEGARHEKRAGYVAAVKQTAGYKEYLKKREAGNAEALAAPRTPDVDVPTELCSKRQWETKIMAWRTNLSKWGSVTVHSEKTS